LEANSSIVTCIIVFTGIMGPLFGPFLFKLLRVRDGKSKCLEYSNICLLNLAIFR
jgi:putative effector of murein hydrolase